MKRANFGLLACAALLAEIPTIAQDGAVPDPRIGLKAGFRDAGTAALNLELVASLPRPRGFFDPAAPAGQAPRRVRRVPTRDLQRGAPPGADRRGGRMAERARALALRRAR